MPRGISNIFQSLALICSISLFFVVILCGCSNSKQTVSENNGTAFVAKDIDPTQLGKAQKSSTPASSSAQNSALTQAKDALAKDPKDVKARIKAAIILDTQGDASAAEDMLRDGLKLGIKNAELYHTVGMFYMKHHVKTASIEALFAETQLEPKNALAHSKLAEALGYMGKSDESMIEYKRAIELDPKLPDPYLGMAYLYNTPENHNKAIEYIKKYIATSPNKGPGYGLLSRVYLNMHQYDEAIKAGENAVKEKSDEPNLWYVLGQAYFYNPGKTNLQAAKTAFLNTIKYGATSHAHFELANVYLRLNEIDKAATHYQESISLDPTNGKTYYQLGQTLMRLGKKKEGAEAIAKSKPLLDLNQKESVLLDKLVVAPHSAKVKYDLGNVYFKLKLYYKAKNWFRSALEDDSRYSDAQRMMAEADKLMPESVRSEEGQ